MNKDTLRKSFLQKRTALSYTQWLEESQEITQKAISYIVMNNISTIHTYLSIKNEPITDKIIDFCLKSEITVVVPKCMPKNSLKHLVLENLSDLTTSTFNTKIPKNELEYTGKIDLIIVPALGFDYNGNRLGFGAGYYDRFLADNSESVKIGLAFDFQVIPSIPTEPHDIPMNIVFTPSREFIFD